MNRALEEFELIQESLKYEGGGQFNIWGVLVLKLSASYGILGTIAVKGQSLLKI